MGVGGQTKFDAANSPPQLRRGEPRPKGRGWGGVGPENDFVDQHHPGAASFEASPYRARALRRHPSSAEEGSFFVQSSYAQNLNRNDVCTLRIGFTALGRPNCALVIV